MSDTAEELAEGFWNNLFCKHRNLKELYGDDLIDLLRTALLSEREAALEEAASAMQREYMSTEIDGYEAAAFIRALKSTLPGDVK